MFFQIVTLSVLLLLTRIYVMLANPPRKLRERKDGETCAVAVLLGSGGHTNEALRLISGLDFSRCSPRIYIVSQGDTLSEAKAVSLERIKAVRGGATPRSDGQMDYKILIVPRARRVHQSVWTVLPTFMHSVFVCIYLVSIAPLLEKDSLGTPFADLLVMNGPGTCVTLCAAVMANKFLGLPHPKMLYVESYARVRSLSLSGRILRCLVDRFVVQWPSLLSGRGRGECYGCLV